jgi:hypothetical protein
VLGGALIGATYDLVRHNAQGEERHDRDVGADAGQPAGRR